MMNSPLISVITVSYNAALTIEQTILSVINQTYQNIEYIIIDGGSTDGTLDIIRKYTDKITYWVSEPDDGIYDAMNKGIKVATGKWINFMNSGDSFCDNNVLERIFSVFYNEKVRFIYGDTILNYDGHYKKAKPLPINYLKKGMPFCHQSVFIRNDSINEYKTKYKIAADFDYFFNAYKSYGENCFLYLAIPISVYEAISGVSANRIKTYREYLLIRNDKFKTIKFFLFKILNAI